jgi:hypothetical protein
LQIIDCEHPVKSVGYCFFEKRKRLKDEFKGKTGRELGQLRKDGVELNEEVSVDGHTPHVTFINGASC